MPFQSEKFRSWLPHGFDFESPATTSVRLKLEESIRKVFLKNNLKEVTPPYIDYARTFSLTNNRNHLQSNSFEFTGNTGERLAIRSDITVQIIKAAANRRLPVHESMGLCYIQPVFHNLEWGYGNNRAMIQSGAEWIGNYENRIEKMLGLIRQMIPPDQDFRMLYGDAAFLKHLGEWFPKHLRRNFANLFYNKDTQALIQLAESVHLEPHKKQILVQTPLMVGSDHEILKQLKVICQEEAVLMEILDLASQVHDVIYDFSLASELSYYTGPVIEGYLAGSHKKILSGGIYDDLYGEFSQENKAACGFALDLSGLMETGTHSK